MFREIIVYTMLAYYASGCAPDYKIPNNPILCDEPALHELRVKSTDQVTLKSNYVVQEQYDQKLKGCVPHTIEMLLN